MLEAAVKELLREEQAAALGEGLAALQERYTFLVHIFKYHSCVEDEVVYPALDAKVKNVTLAYSVEHEVEERLFEQLALLLTEALAQEGVRQAATVQALACKVEEIHTTLRKHLAKEEEQLLPLLLRHFSHAQQAQLVAQFLCTIPLASVEVVLTWLMPSVPAAEQVALRSKVGGVVEDRLLRHLLDTWLAPSPAAKPSSRLTSATASGLRLQPTMQLVVPTQLAAASSALQRPLPAEAAAACASPATLSHQRCHVASRDDRFGISSSIGDNQKEGGGSAGADNYAKQGLPGCTTSSAAVLDIHPMQQKLPSLRTTSIPLAYFAGDASSAAAGEANYCGGAGGHAAASDCCRLQLGSTACGSIEECTHEPQSGPSPIEDILHLHAAIRSALESFTDSARALRDADHGEGSSKALEALVERHRFLRAVCVCHSASEEEVLMPAARRLCQPGDVAYVKLQALEEEHTGEASHFEEMGRLLRELKSLLRRHSRKANGMTLQLVTSAEAVQHTLTQHMATEEATLFPLLQRHLCPAEQRAMVWRTVRAMPLRLLERVMPWLAAKLPEARVDSMVGNLRAAAAPGDSPLVQLLSMWTARGRSPLTSSESNDPKLFENSTCGPPCTPSASDIQPPAKRQRMSQLEVGSSQELTTPTAAEAATIEVSVAAPALEYCNDVNPIDHIFQFHKALRRDLQRMVDDSKRFTTAVHAPPVPGAPTFAQMMVQLEGRFQFMWGLYRAHSHSEDEIVFPALERKEALANVSHAYTLDHQQEEQMLQQTHQVILALKGAEDIQEQRQLAQQLHRMSAALRATLEQHVQAEEQELWPLFAENFSREEQEALVGVIVGRTGAEVLASLLPWVTGSFTDEEHSGMMDSLRSATRNTGFDRWLESTLGTAGDVRTVSNPLPATVATNAINAESESATHSPLPAATACSAAADDSKDCIRTRSGAVSAASAAPKDAQGWPFGEDTAAVAGLRADIPSPPPLLLCGGGGGNRHTAPLAAVAEYLVATASTAAPPAAVPGAAPPPSQSLAGAFRPGWEDIFRMNQKTLEGAVRRMGADTTLEPAHKAYLMQHIMASRYIVAQQQSKDVTAGWRDANRAGRPPFRTLTDEGGLGCKHYARGAALVAPCCGGRKFTCRHCHDEEVDHPLDIKAVISMACMHCGAVGPVAGKCSSCNKQLAAHFCAICRLWDDTAGRQIYHCPYCNLCRRGAGLGLDACHCMQCNCCMHLAEFATHKCRDLSTCPVCTEYLFDSSQPYRELPCGHFMHSHCFGQYTRYNYTCPICTKSVGDMTVYFQMIDALVGASAPLPPEYATRKQPLLCNDCNAHSSAPFHFVYHKCCACGSYNTRLLASADTS